MSTTRIAVIGAGFSGTLLTLHLLRQCPTAEIVLIERNPQFGRGQAYATGNANHLLNVPAGRMSAFRDRPNNFLEWLQSTPHPELGEAPPTAGSFVPRMLFGRYIRYLLKEQIRHADKDGRLELVRGDVLRMDASDSRLALELDRDRRTVADATVLAIGNFPPEPPPVADPGFYDSALYRADPWAPDALTDLDPEAPVLLIGTGLTMVDTVVSLLDQGHTGPIHALSRRGLLPHRHNGSGQPPPNEPSSYPTVLSDLVRLMRREITRTAGLGGTWHPVIDALRPITTELWQTASAEDKARFVRHLRPWWDIHRHRIAADVSDRIEAARERGQLTKCAGRIREYRETLGGVEVTFQPRGTSSLASFQVARVVNCSGPACDYDRIPHPLIRNLLAEGLVRPDPLRLGLDVTTTCAVRDRQGAISRRLFAVGPVTRGAFWEMTAVPDIRRQTEHLAEHLGNMTARKLHGLPASASPRP
jgi:uncharacterized NAD(P)/FAD-binding protein YdhS